MEYIGDTILGWVEKVEGLQRNMFKLPTEMPTPRTSWTLLYRVPLLMLLAWTVSSLFEGLYNISNHPLAEFPGPWLAAFTPLYQAWYQVVCREKWTDVLERLHEKYGKVVRVGPNELHFSDPEAYHEIYNHENHWDKDESFYHSFRQHYSTFGFTSFEQNQERRRVLSPLFLKSAVADLQDVIQTNIHRFCEILTTNDAQNQSSDFFLGLRCLTLDVLTKYCFDRSTDALGAPDFAAPALLEMQQSLSANPSFRHFSLLWSLVSLLPRALRAAIHPAAGHQAPLSRLFKIWANEAKTNPESLDEASHTTVFKQLLQPSRDELARDPANAKKVKSPTQGSLVDEAETLVWNGVDTTANAILMGVFHLIEQPLLVTRLRKELIEVWPKKDGDVPSLAVLEKLPVLSAVVKESLRIDPGGIVSPLPRVFPKGGLTISGSVIPPHTTVGASAPFVHNSESIFSDPKKFNPDRWLNADKSGKTKEEMDKWLVAFSRGPRTCLGQNLATSEMYMTFASLFRLFDLRVDPVSGKVKDVTWTDSFHAYIESPHLRVFCRPVTK